MDTDATPGNDPEVRRPASFAIAGVAGFIAIMTAFHFIQPELNPLERYGSEYAAGRMGWLMSLAFAALAAALGGLALGFHRALEPPVRSRAPVALLTLAAAGALASGLFNADLQGASGTWEGVVHDLAGFVAFVCLLPAMLLISRRLARAGRLAGPHRVLRALAWLVPALFLAMLFGFERAGLVGLGQRLFLAAVFAWLLLAAHGLRSGAFAPSHGTPP